MLQAAAWGCEPTPFEVYERVHYSNRKYGLGVTDGPDDPYVYPKAGRVAVSFLKLLVCFYVCVCMHLLVPNHDVTYVSVAVDTLLRG